ncbi:MAG: hypothetical protein JO243_03865 [Solirubrobacterales bacterium]|nr:hypothetical protein [Solirubrobacterales bacterium]
MECELRDVAPGLWLWRTQHPDCSTPWDPLVSSFCVEVGGEVMVIDPLAPPVEARNVWERLDRHPPNAVIVLSPHHIRDLDLMRRPARA